MSLRYLTGTALDAALLRLGRYCYDKELETGREANVPYLMERINSKFGLVPDDRRHLLIQSVERAYFFLKNQELDSISRLGYVAFKGASFLNLEDELASDLDAFQKG